MLVHTLAIALDLKLNNWCSSGMFGRQKPRPEARQSGRIPQPLAVCSAQRHSKTVTRRTKQGTRRIPKMTDDVIALRGLMEKSAIPIFCAR